MITCISTQSQVATFIDGMINGGMGVTLIIFGILGWQRTLTVLRTARALLRRKIFFGKNSFASPTYPEDKIQNLYTRRH